VQLAAACGTLVAHLGASVRHWLVMFRPETYVLAQAHGLMAVLHQHRRRFADVAAGDRFVAYISRQRVLDAHGEVTGDPYQDVADVPEGWRRYTERAPVRFDRTGGGVDAKRLLWGLSVCEAGIKTDPANLLFCLGGFMEVPEEDYRWLVEVVEGRAGER
jgi:hypothetical protein